MAHTLLLIDDDHKLARLLTAFADTQGYTLVWADRPSAGAPHLARGVDLILLDVMLPEQDGFAVCRGLRAAGDRTPVIMLTARGDDLDRIQGLKIGADDYLPKPFNPLELFARVEAVLRRVPAAAPRTDGLDADRLILTVGDRQIQLTTSEFLILQALTASAGRIYTREQLLSVLGEDASDRFDRSIDAHISRLRTRIEADPRRPEHMITVRGLGYRFVW
ncbi:MAG: response regulator transcription factor [Candidatus Sericytochromatia bacterium]|nr:response regulator transcription factor [Candidatus Sericytochromatia bacterium]